MTETNPDPNQCLIGAEGSVNIAIPKPAHLSDVQELILQTIGKSEYGFLPTHLRFQLDQFNIEKGAISGEPLSQGNDGKVFKCWNIIFKLGT